MDFLDKKWVFDPVCILTLPVDTDLVRLARALGTSEADRQDIVFSTGKHGVRIAFQMVFTVGFDFDGRAPFNDRRMRQIRLQKKDKGPFLAPHRTVQVLDERGLLVQKMANGRLVPDFPAVELTFIHVVQRF